MEKNERLLTPCEETADCPYGETRDGKFYTPCEICPVITKTRQAVAKEIFEEIERKFILIKGCRYISITSIDNIKSRYLEVKDGK